MTIVLVAQDAMCRTRSVLCISYFFVHFREIFCLHSSSSTVGCRRMRRDVCFFSFWYFIFLTLGSTYFSLAEFRAADAGFKHARFISFPCAKKYTSALCARLCSDEIWRGRKVPHRGILTLLCKVCPFPPAAGHGSTEQHNGRNQTSFDGRTLVSNLSQASGLWKTVPKLFSCFSPQYCGMCIDN